MSSSRITENDFTATHKHPMGVHKGNAIWQLIHINKYAWQVAVELAQNAIDENAKHVRIIVDVPRAIIWCYDDGIGVNKREMLELWNQVCTSIKKDKKDKTGSKGIAKLANLSIACINIFISRPTDVRSSRYFKLLIDKSTISENEEPELTSFDLMEGYSFGDMTSFKPTTMVRLEKVQRGALAEFSDPQSIADRIGKAFARQIRSRQIDFQIIYCPNGWGKGNHKTVIVRPKEYEGERQKLYEMKTPYGVVKFDMTTTWHPAKNPELVIDYVNPTGGVWTFDLEKVPGILSRRDIAEVLGSGHFQGRIELSFCSLVPDRQGFVDDEQRQAFIDAVNTYVYEIAKPYHALLKSEADAEREERILFGEQQRMNDLFAANPELVLQSELRTFFPGGIPAPGEKGKPDKKKPGRRTPSMEPFMKPGVKPGGKKEPVDDKKKPAGPKSPKRPPKNTKVEKGETHMGLKIVRKLANQEPFFSGPSWAKDGIIFFNVEHPYWIAAAKKGDKALAAYVHEHTCKELAGMMITVTNEESRDRMREAFFEVFDDHYSRLTAQCG